MPYRAASKVKGLYKKHNLRCPNQEGLPTNCDCPWYGRYRGISKGLAAWACKTVDPRTKAGAEAVLARLKTVIDERKYSPEGEQRSLGSGQRFSDFVLEWKTHYAEEYGLTSNSLDDMLNVLTDGLGSFTLEHLSGDPVHIERWLNRMQKERNWSPNTWNRYYGLLNTLCVRATRWKTNGAPRMTHNPMTSIERRVGTKKKFGVRIEEAVEDKLFEACATLNRPQHAPHSIRLDWDKVDTIRKRVAGGESQSKVARSFGISSGLCCQIVKGDIWNREKYRVGTKGDLMRLRLMMALDTGVRREEMMLIQIKHINFRPALTTVEGEQLELFAVEVQSKGEKTTGEKEFVWVGTERLKEALKKRRFALRNDPEAYVFGTETGKRQKAFRRMWRELFTLAGLKYGRDKGVVWHTLRHEFCSRAAENTGDPVVAQELARHKDLRTTQGYLHPRLARVLAAATGLNRKS
jgi:integrase